jgi:murein DD-endopeptidase MepM/ murein hydrolase activator NlpD
VRPVPETFPVSQDFGGGATAGVAPSPDPNSGIAYLVYLYGNYQPLGHAGRDIACPIGTPVRAMAGGTVLWADWATNLPGDDSWVGWASRWFLYKRFPGICSVIQHPWGIGVYAHLSDNNMAPAGMKVREGQVIGLSGNTKAIGPAEYVGAHLHVEALIDLGYSNANGLIYGRTDPAQF